MYKLSRSLLFALPPETAHHLALRSSFLLPRQTIKACPINAMGLEFPHAVGLAAGLDKNAAYLDGLARMGFAFLEVGTVTPKAQSGNPKPRLFRLPEHQAIINRMGFNNLGVDTLVNNVLKSNYNGILGINIGKNKATPNAKAIDDYLYCLERVYPLASYITINVSSPNTAGLRDLQEADALKALVAQIIERGEQLANQHGKRKPLLVKVAPDLDKKAIESMAEIFNQLGIDGVIATNTSLDKSRVTEHQYGHEQGGLSGQPIFDQATRVQSLFREALDSNITLIGAGGIINADNAGKKVQAGAQLVQIYTGLIYKGPKLIKHAAEACCKQLNHG
ncbi:MAG: quinone-dependent dihydroorotate dehydrogenase [bacterium]